MGELFGWFTKPKLLVSAYDQFLMYSEIFIVILAIGLFLEIKKTLRRRRIMKNHHKGCTCWVCLNINQ